MWKRLVIVALVAIGTIVPSLLLKVEKWNVGIDLSIPLVLGTALAIFLGFRTNSAYERWWEARKLWGSIVNDTRSIGRLFKGFLGSVGEHDRKTVAGHVRTLVYRQAAWPLIFSQQLRGRDRLQGTEHLLSEEERLQFAGASNAALAVLNRQGAAVRQAFEAGLLDVRQAIYLEETLSKLTGHQGGCERIKSTVFPVHYTYFTKVFIWVFLALLGLSLPAHEDVGFFSVPAVFVIGWVFFLVDGIGDYMQDPFEENRNSTPISTIARTLEINLRELIEDQDIPEALKPVEGALW